MNQNPGAIALVGSGEYSVQMQELEAELLHSAISRGKKNTFIQIPTASSHEGDTRRAYWQRLGREQSDRIGSECIYLPIHEREDAFSASFVEQIKGAGLIYFSGGDPHRVAEIFTGSSLWNAILDQWKSGTSLAGCSAGAMAFGETIMGIRQPIYHSQGLGLLLGMEIIPHYDKMLEWLPDHVASFMARDVTDTTVGIDEDTALIRNRLTDTWRKVGRGRVHVLRGSIDIE